MTRKRTKRIQSDRNRLLHRWSVDLVERHFGFEMDALRADGRGEPERVIARQVATYLLTTSTGASHAQAAEVVNRHRSTVGHSIRQVERMRDDPRMDADIRALERGVDAIRNVLEAETV